MIGILIQSGDFKIPSVAVYKPYRVKNVTAL